MAANDNDTLKVRILAGVVIQILALILLGIIIWIDSSYPDTDFTEIEYALVGIAAAPAAREVVKQIGSNKKGDEE